MKPRIFIASSVENLDVAYAAQENLEYNLEYTVWSQDAFAASKYTLEALDDYLDTADFGLFVFTPNDITIIRDVSQNSVRDNVLFELGLFIGKLGKNRNFVLLPNSAKDFRLPTDLLGIIPVTYESDRQDGNLVAALGPASNRIRKAAASLGSKSPLPVESTLPSVAVESQVEVVTDPNDCIALIQSWMGSRPADLNRQAIKFDDIDRELKIQAGSTRAYIENVARRWGYTVSTKGKDYILFVEGR